MAKREKSLTTRELAERLGWEPARVAELCRLGLIRAEKVKGQWRIPAEEAERLLVTAPVERRILEVKAAINRSRLVRAATGRATARGWFWLGVGFGRGRFALGRLIVLGLYLACLELKRALARFTATRSR